MSTGATPPIFSIDWDRARPFVKHAEWHFFYIVLAVAVWAIFST